MLAKYQENSQRRVLTKVRRNFAVKKDQDEDQVVDTSARFISDSNMYILSGTIGLVEVNRKIFIGPQYLNQHFSISKSFVQDKLSSRAVLLSLCSNPNRSAISCEYTMKRLESYGDLELATWAHRMTKFQRSYPKLMDDYLSTRKLDNAEQVMDIKDKLHRMREEIESKYAYYKVVKHYNRETNYLSEISYSEDFISAMGHSVESFLGWTEKNGLPAVFDHECPVYLSTIKKVLDGSVLSSNYVSQGQEYKTSIIDKKGLKRAVQVQSICLLEPTEDGYIMNGYFVLKKSDPKNEYLAESTDFKPNLWKQKKMDNSLEKDMEVEGSRTSSGEC